MNSAIKLFLIVFLTIGLVTPLTAQRYKSANLEIIRLSDHVFQHISYLKTEDFGKVSCNGMIVVDDHEAVVFDTPAEDSASQELIDWIKTQLNSKLKAVVATHFHADCLGGLNSFHAAGVPSYAEELTLGLAKQKHFPVPQHGFKQSQALKVGSISVQVGYFGAGHTRDNVVAYVPSEKILFGGCLIKEIGAGKGNLEDADENAWPLTVHKVKAKYPTVKLIIPGHGKVGGVDLLDYTSNLFAPALSRSQ
jgi:metallo-beta-lactamase class B